MPHRTLAGRLRDAIEGADVDVWDLAERVAVSHRAFQAWLDGSSTPEATQIHALAEALDVDAAWIETGHGTAPDVDLEAERAEYQTEAGWRFRLLPEDGARDYGNANIWAFEPDLDTFVREVGQNLLDVVRGTSASVTFRLMRLRGDRLATFKEAIKWDHLYPHLAASAKQGQKFGRILEQALARLEAEQELVVLRIEEQRTTGLTGAERGSGSNFAALTRNNLDSNKESAGAGGAFGLGKAVLWRTSELSTVLFNSDLAVPEEGKQEGRLIGRTELSFHETEEGQFAGPGWFGRISEGSAVSYWGNRALARDLLLARTKGVAGTSILVVGFHDPKAEEARSVHELAGSLGRALGKNFWPALEHGRLEGSVEVASGAQTDDLEESVVVTAESSEPEFADMLAKYRANDLVESLEAPGQVAARKVRLDIPARRDGKHDRLTHEAIVLVRRAEEESATPNRVAFFRGTGMVVQERDMSNIRVGARPFHAAVLCGTAAGAGPVDAQAEEFLRLAEPPAHNRWQLTPDLTATFARGSGVAIDRFFDRVCSTIADLVGPASQDLSDGPRGLKELLKVSGERDHTSRPRVTSVDGTVDDHGRWDLTVEVTTKAQPGVTWIGTPVCLFQAESGPNQRVQWAHLEAVSNCAITSDNRLRIPPNVRRARFRALSDPTSHLLPAGESAVTVDLRRLEKQGADQ